MEKNDKTMRLLADILSLIGHIMSKKAKPIARGIAMFVMKGYTSSTYKHYFRKYCVVILRKLIGLF
jgi:hypothetical protein